MAFPIHLDKGCQDEGWSPATYITAHSKAYDLTHEFLLITEPDLKTLPN
jgi:hypothetical protein